MASPVASPPNSTPDAVQRISLRNREYAHIEDANRGIVLLEMGPRVLTLEAHQRLLKKAGMIELGIGRFCVIRNPVEKNESGQPRLDGFGQARLTVGDREVRIGPQAFVLYPGEELDGEVQSEAILGVYDALKVRAQVSFVDPNAAGGARERQAGDEWLVCGPRRYIPGKEVLIVSREKAHLLIEAEYCVILNPFDRAQGRIQEGRRRVVPGPDVFFLEPGEELEGNIRNKHVLSERMGLKLEALDDFSDGGVARRAGDTWIIRGPQTYVPNEKVKILQEIQVVSLGQGEGLYVRDLRTGQVHLVEGPCQFMLEAWQELHEKRLSPEAEAILARLDEPGGTGPKPSGTPAALPKDRTRAIVLRVEDNSAVLINDFEHNTSRVAYGPAKVMLQPYEDVAVIDLSGGTPKKPKQIKVVFLHLGPDFSTDQFEVATRDHARLRIKLSYKWQFERSGDPERDRVIFRVNDFVGYICENLASRIRQVAAENDFESFHKAASTLIRRAVFGVDEAGKVRKERLVVENQLRIIDIDIKDISPVDEKTAQKLHEAIDTNIQIQLDASKQEAEARAELKRIQSEEEKQLADIKSRKKAEEQRQELIELQTRNAMLQLLGESRNEAEALRERSRIETETILARAEAEALGMQIRTDAEVLRERKLLELALERQSRQNQLEVERQAKMRDIEAAQFQRQVEALGGGQNLVQMMAAQSQAAMVGGIEKLVFVPSGAGFNLFTSMQDLLGKMPLNGTTMTKPATTVFPAPESEPHS
jgi:major vault protein